MKEKGKQNFILVIFHNLDAKQYVDNESIKLLSRIFNISYIRVLCSVDHVKWAISVNPTALEKMNLIFIKCDTNSKYVKEFSLECNTLKVEKEN